MTTKSKIITINGGPIRKAKTFCPNPVVEGGIPDYADSYSNPKVWGTEAWREWWTEQISRCLNGYTTGGLWIPGRYYYYLNFFKISTVGKGNHAPMFTDLDYEFFLIVEEAKKTNKGVISIKARRKGLSYKVVGGIFDYGFRFRDKYFAGICAGLSTHSEGFYTKFLNQESLCPPELRVHKLSKSDEKIVAGYHEKTDTGWLDKGSKNTVFCKTMFNNPNVFKGEQLDDCVFEEGGEFELLLEGYEATKPCFAVGDRMVGTPYIYGCVCAGTKVWTNEGDLVNIEDLDVSKGILGYDTDKGLVSKETIIHWKPPFEKQCYRITTSTGRHLECSDDHPILWSKKGFSKRTEKPKVDGKRRRSAIKKVKWTEAKDINIGDQVAIIDRVPFNGVNRMWEPRVVGWLVGDGSYGFNKTPVLSSCDEEVNSYIDQNLDVVIEKSADTNDGKIYRESRLRGICGKLRELGIYGQTKLNKTLPLKIHTYCYDDVCEFLGGLFDSDGCAYLGDTQYCISLTSASFELLKEVQILMQRLGIHGNIVENPPSPNNEKDKNVYYRLEIRDIVSIRCFSENIRFSINYKQDKVRRILTETEGKVPRRSKDIDGIFFERVISIEDIGVKPVYNLTAGNTHTYIANGIVTHNTGGNMNKGSKGFSEMWADADSYNLIKFWVSARKLYFPAMAGSINERGRLDEDIPYLKKKYPEKYMRVGMQDEKRAEELIMAKREKLSKASNKKAYYDELQNTPLSVKEAFLSFSSNNYDSTILSERAIYLMRNDKKTSYCVLEYVKDEKGLPVQPLKVRARPAITDPSSDNYDHPDYWVEILHHPKKGFLHLDVGGMDGYDIDQSTESKSLGATMIYRRGVEGVEGNMPVALYYKRPKRKEIFYEISLKMSIYYNLIEGMLADAGSPGIIGYFKDNGGEKYLAKRPRTMESEHSKQMHDYGMKFTTYSLPLCESMVQSAVLDYAHKWEFEDIIHDCQNYQTGDGDSDCDAHSALQLCLAKIKDMDVNPIDMDEVKKSNPFYIPERRVDGEGNVYFVNNPNSSENQDSSQQGDLFLQMIKNGRI